MAEAFAIEFTSPGGEPLSIEWPPGSLGPLAAGDDGEPRWRLGGEIDWDEVEALRVLSASLGDGRWLALAAVRPAGARGHGDEAIGALIVEEGVADRVDEALLSTEYGADGLPRRVGIEIDRGDDAMPLRIAGDVSSASTELDGALRRVRARLVIRLAGEQGSGSYEIVTPA